MDLEALPGPYINLLGCVQGNSSICSGTTYPCTNSNSFTAHLNALPNGTYRYRGNACCNKVFPFKGTLYTTVTSTSGANCFNNVYPMRFENQEIWDGTAVNENGDRWVFPSGIHEGQFCINVPGLLFRQLTLDCMKTTGLTSDGIGYDDIANEDNCCGNLTTRCYQLESRDCINGVTTQKFCNMKVSGRDLYYQSCDPFMLEWRNVRITNTSDNSCCETGGFANDLVALATITITE